MFTWHASMIIEDCYCQVDATNAILVVRGVRWKMYRAAEDCDLSLSISHSPTRGAEVAMGGTAA